jgi:uncharacterized DUF497 family protein
MLWAISSCLGSTQGPIQPGKAWRLLRGSTTVFQDESARLIDDPDHSEYEDRFLLLGYSLQARCLVVTHCYRQSDSVIRLIFARPATAQEEQVYWRLR